MIIRLYDNALVFELYDQDRSNSQTCRRRQNTTIQRRRSSLYRGYIHILSIIIISSDNIVGFVAISIDVSNGGKGIRLTEVVQKFAAKTTHI